MNKEGWASTRKIVTITVTSFSIRQRASDRNVMTRCYGASHPFSRIFGTNLKTKHFTDIYLDSSIWSAAYGAFRYRNQHQRTNTILPLVPDKYNDIVTKEWCAAKIKINGTSFSVGYNMRGCSKHIRVRYCSIAASDGAIFRDRMENRRNFSSSNCIKVGILECRDCDCERSTAVYHSLRFCFSNRHSELIWLSCRMAKKLFL